MWRIKEERYVDSVLLNLAGNDICYQMIVVHIFMQCLQSVRPVMVVRFPAVEMVHKLEEKLVEPVQFAGREHARKCSGI